MMKNHRMVYTMDPILDNEVRDIKFYVSKHLYKQIQTDKSLDLFVKQHTPEGYVLCSNVILVKEQAPDNWFEEDYYYKYYTFSCKETEETRLKRLETLLKNKEKHLHEAERNIGSLKHVIDKIKETLKQND